MQADQVLTLIKEQIPFVGQLDMRFLEFNADRVELECLLDEGHARPGGTISGPVMMALGDVVAYACILARNPMALSSVTVGFQVHFFRRPKPDKIRVSGKVMKMGRRLAFCDILLFQESEKNPVAQITCSYAIAEGNG
ncbi:MAG: PaaI family thioesterase [Alphaproteobacteria bacterium]|jgi:uncharacterized protein (TIGR00369 family)|nr:PaaI family thioesterase [Alphaproteobacteria bacterium]